MFTLCSDMPDGTIPPHPADQAASAGVGAGRTAVRLLAERQLEALEELAEVGLKIARAIGRRVDEAACEPPPLAELDAAALAYSRVARAVRQTILLQSKVAESLEAARKAATARAGVKARIAGIVRKAIEAEQDDREQVERLAAEAMERLERADFDESLAQPVRETIAAICRTLGLSPDWRGLADEIEAVEAMARSLLAPRPETPAADPEPIGPHKVYWLGEDGRRVLAPGCDTG